MKFWRLHHPSYGSPSAARLLNGELTHPFRLPGIACSECNTTWGGSRILPYTLPESLQARVELRQQWPIEDAAHRRLRDAVLKELRAAGASIETLRPGDAFQPAILDIAAAPDADFLWGPESVVVSERVHTALTMAPLRGAGFVPVQLRLGRRVSADRRASEVMAEAEGAQYYELVVRAESGFPPGVEPVTYCGSCGRRSFDHEKRQLVMQPEMWKGEQIFLLGTTQWIMVTEQVKQVIESLQPANVEFLSLDDAP